MKDEKFTVEVLYEPDYLDKKSIIAIASPVRLHCLTYRNKRFYWTYNEETDEPIFYKGSSQFVRSILPAEVTGEKYLLNWALEEFEDKDHYKLFMNTAAAYGTFLHWQIKKLVENKGFTHDELEKDLWDYIEQENLSPHLFYRWFDDCASDLLSFIAWVRAYNVRVMAVEFPIAGNFGVASRIDLVCHMDYPLKANGEPYKSLPKDTSKVKKWIKDVLMIVDIKSKLYSKNRGSFYKPHAYQVFGYRKLWNDAYSHLGLEVDAVANWSPAGNGEGFNFKVWTNITIAQEEEVEETETGPILHPQEPEFNYENKGVDPKLLDDLIDLHMKWFAPKAIGLKRLKFKEVSLYPVTEIRKEKDKDGNEVEVEVEVSQHNYIDVYEIAKKYRKSKDFKAAQKKLKK